jgi:hypothetical protein
MSKNANKPKEDKAAAAPVAAEAAVEPAVIEPVAAPVVAPVAAPVAAESDSLANGLVEMAKALDAAAEPAAEPAAAPVADPVAAPVASPATAPIILEAPVVEKADEGEVAAAFNAQPEPDVHMPLSVVSALELLDMPTIRWIENKYGNFARPKSFWTAALAEYRGA